MIQRLEKGGAVDLARCDFSVDPLFEAPAGVMSG